MLEAVIGLVTAFDIKADVLVVFCPRALVLATPTAIMAAIGNATKHGFLMREGDALERLASVSNMMFGKTGTLTYGTPKVIAVHSFRSTFSEKEIYRLAAGAEMRSEHPLGKAIVDGYQNQTKQTLPQAEEFSMLPGRGVCAVIEGKEITAGNRELLAEKILLSRRKRTVFP